MMIPLGLVAAEPIPIWPDLAPGETTKNIGTPRPANPKDNPPITRVEKITQPTIAAFIPEGGGNGAAVLVLPGGGFGYVVPDLEGSETAAFLNPLGISVFVLNYRTKLGNEADQWRRPLQDSQRAIRFLRANAAKWKLDPAKIGLLAFSAGGQVGAIHIGEFGDAYEKTDVVDEQSSRPDFAMLVYPWNVGDNKSAKLMEAIKIGKSAPPTFLVHTDDDHSSALGAASIYMELKKAGLSAELHIYQNGGHGYGVREREGSVIGTWKNRAADWLKVRGIGAVPKQAAAAAVVRPLTPLVAKLKQTLDLSKKRLVKQDLATFKSALMLYRLEAGMFPSTEQGLGSLTQKPTLGKVPGRWTQVLKAEQLDPWGNAYGYRFPPTHNKADPDVWSMGPDGKLGTGDDLGNWEK